MSLAAFKASAKGTRLAGILTSEETIRRMIGKSEIGRPAVEAIGKEVEAAVGSLDDEQKKLVGRWAKEILVPRGWVPDRKGRVARGNFFSRGTIYRRAAPSNSQESRALARLERARQLVRQLPHPLPSVDEFLAERRRMWGEG